MNTHIDWMNIALKHATYSKDPSVQNGAIVVDLNANWIVGAGSNNMVTSSDDETRWERPQKYMWVEHAERSSIYSIISSGIIDNESHVSNHNLVMYCPWAACADCARAIIKTGINTLYRLPMGEHEGWTESIVIGDTMLREALVEIVEIPLEDVDIPEGLRLGQYR